MGLDFVPVAFAVEVDLRAGGEVYLVGGIDEAVFLGKGDGALGEGLLDEGLCCCGEFLGGNHLVVGTADGGLNDQGCECCQEEFVRFHNLMFLGC